jgi:hypothetical protein
MSLTTVRNYKQVVDFENEIVSAFYSAIQTGMDADSMLRHLHRITSNLQESFENEKAAA